MPCADFRGRYYNPDGNTVQDDSFALTISRQNISLLDLTAPCQKYPVILRFPTLNVSPRVRCYGFDRPLQTKLVGMKATC